MTNRVEIVSKKIGDQTFTGLRIYLELPVTIVENGVVGQAKGPFIHNVGDDDSSAITFWGKSDLWELVETMKDKLDEYYSAKGEKEGG
jgi:hypothetical protein